MTERKRGHWGGRRGGGERGEGVEVGEEEGTKEFKEQKNTSIDCTVQENWTSSVGPGH